MTFSPRYLVALNLVLLALAAYSAAAIVDTLVVGRLIPPPRVQLSPEPVVPEVQPRNQIAFYKKVTERDIFNSAVEPTPGPPPVATVSQLAVKLMGVVIFRDPSMSSCVIEDSKSHKQAMYRVGDTLEGTDASVKSIDWERVIVVRGGKEEFLDLAKAPTSLASMSPNLSSTTGTVVSSPGSGSPGARPVMQAAGKESNLDQHIQMVSENEYIIDRSEVDSAFENMSQLFTQVRAVPHFEDGVSTGFRLFAIKQGSLFDKIGLKNGDVLQSINGTDLSDASRALTLSQELRGASALNVAILRNKEPQTMNYQIR